MYSCLTAWVRLSACLTTQGPSCAANRPFGLDLGPDLIAPVVLMLVLILSLRHQVPRLAGRHLGAYNLIPSLASLLNVAVGPQ